MSTIANFDAQQTSHLSLTEAQTCNVMTPMLPPALASLMLDDLLLVNLAQIAEVGGAQGLWVIDPELLYEEERVDVLLL